MRTKSYTFVNQYRLSGRTKWIPVVYRLDVGLRQSWNWIEQNLRKCGVMNRHLLRAWFPCGDTESLP